jgi:hypothetical protein
VKAYSTLLPEGLINPLIDDGGLAEDCHAVRFQLPHDPDSSANEIGWEWQHSPATWISPVNHEGKLPPVLDGFKRH